MALKLADLLFEFSVPAAEALGRHMGDITSSIKAVVGFASFGFGASSAVLGGWVTAGLAGTVQGQELLLSTQQLAREVASVFLPAIQFATDTMRDLTMWFRNLNGDDQDLLGSVALWGLGALSLTTTMGKILAITAGFVKAVMAAAKKFQELTEEFRNPRKWMEKQLEGVRQKYIDTLGPVWGNWLFGNSPYGAVYAQLVGWRKAEELAFGKAYVVEDALFGKRKDEGEKPGAGHRSVGMGSAGGAFESITATGKRIQAAINRNASSGSYAEQVANNFAGIRAANEAKSLGLVALEDRKRPNAPARAPGIVLTPPGRDTEYAGTGGSFGPDSGAGRSGTGGSFAGGKAAQPPAAPTAPKGKLPYYKGTPAEKPTGFLGWLSRVDDFISTAGGLAKDSREAPRGSAIGRWGSSSRRFPTDTLNDNGRTRGGNPLR